MSASAVAKLRQRARHLGFSELRITSAQIAPANQSYYQAFIGKGWHGTMDWLALRSKERSSPQNLWPEARSAIICAMNYGPAHNPLKILDDRSAAAISVYAQNRDYHEVIKGKLKELAALTAKLTGENVKVFVDTAPILEKPLAQQAGIGWQGKHTNLVSRQFGSWLFLGEILTSAELPRDQEEPDHCGQCRRCLDICPTDAFPQAYKLDARRCISYLTIEHKGPIGREFRQAMGNRIYGCDDCLAICPWNKFAKIGKETKLMSQDRNRAPPLAEFLNLDDAGFRSRFSASPIKRIGVERFLRNVLIAAGNSQDPELITPVKARLSDASDLIRGAAVWALWRLLPKPAFDAIRGQGLASETVSSVRREWEATF